MKGRIKFYNRSKDFGFVSGEDGKDYYFNAASVKPLEEKDQVEFTPYRNNRGDMAKQVALIGSQSHARLSCISKLIIAVVLIVIAFILGHFIHW